MVRCFGSFNFALDFALLLHHVLNTARNTCRRITHAFLASWKLWAALLCCQQFKRAVAHHWHYSHTKTSLSPKLASHNNGLHRSIKITSLCCTPQSRHWTPFPFQNLSQSLWWWTCAFGEIVAMSLSMGGHWSQFWRLDHHWTASSLFIAGKIRIKRTSISSYYKNSRNLWVSWKNQQRTVHFWQFFHYHSFLGGEWKLYSSILPQKWKNCFFDFLRTEIVRLKDQSDNWQGLVPFLIPA